MDQLSQTLEGMGSTPDQIAAALLAADVRGVRDSTSLMNPVVRYANRSLDVGGKPEVGAGGTVLRLRLGGRLKEVPLPVAVQVFRLGLPDGRKGR